MKDFLERYSSFCDNTIPPFMYGSHYSTSAGVVLHYNVRLHPFAGLHRQLQGGHFDVSDRLFSSVSRTWEMCTSALSEVKELTPEWFSNPAFLKNSNHFNFGRMQDGDVVDDVILPPWAGGSAERFVEINRAALESDICTEMLPKWIDLIFGFKQRGSAAVEAHNVFFYLTYYGSVDVAAIEDEALRSATELQIAHFGQCPMQIFDKPHPFKRKRRGGPRSIKTSLGLFDIQGGVAAPPFTNSPLTHWINIPAEPPGPNPPLTKVRILSHNRIMAVDASGGFHFFNYMWKMDNKSVHQQEQRVRSQIMAIQEKRRGEEAAIAAAKVLGPEAERQLSFASFDSNGSEEKVDEVDYDVGNFVASRDTSGFNAVPRLMHSSGVCAISHRHFLHGSNVLVLSDGDGQGGLGLQLVDVAKGNVRTSKVVDKACTGRITHIDVDFCSSSAAEVAVVGCVDGGFGVWKFLEPLDSGLPRRPTWRISSLAHSGEPLRALAISVNLRVIVSVSSRKCCIHSLTSGKLLRSFGPHNEGVRDLTDNENVVFAKEGSIAVSKLGMICFSVVKNGTPFVQLQTLDGVWLGEHAVPGGINSLKIVADGGAVCCCSKGAATLHRLSSVRVLEVLDTWNIDSPGYALVGGVGVLDVDFGPDRRVSLYPSVVVVGLEDGGVCIHALRGVGKWSRTVGTGIVREVAGLISKPLGAVGGLGKNLLGGIGGIGKAALNLGSQLQKEAVVGLDEVATEVKKEGGVAGFFRGLGRKGSGDSGR